MSSTILQSLGKQGYRLSPVRTFILEYLSQYAKPIDVQSLLLKLASSLKKVNKTTVYREIDFLLLKGLVKEIEFGDGKKRYEIAHLPHHHHLVCLACNEIEDVMLENELTTIEKKISKKSKFTIERHNLEFFGVCEKCSVR